MKVALTGDIAYSRYFKTAYQTPNLLSEEIIDFLSNSDFTIANVEAPIVNPEKANNGTFIHVSHPKIVEMLRSINANVWNLANNHPFDCGLFGLTQTLEYASQNGASVIGAGTSEEQAQKPLILTKNNIKVGVLTTNALIKIDEPDPKDGGFVAYETNLKARIKALKKSCDYLLLVVHGGEEFSQLPLPHFRKKYLKFLKWGADVVVGHHPHVPQNYERVSNKLVFYSLGNFIFDTDYQRAQRNTDKGVLVKLDFSENGVTFEHLCTKIDRQTNTIAKGEQIPIFTNLPKKEYNRLKGLAVSDFCNNLKAKLIFCDEGYKVESPRVYKKYQLSRYKIGERLSFRIAKAQGKRKPNKKCNPDLVKYITGEI